MRCFWKFSKANFVCCPYKTAIKIFKNRNLENGFSDRCGVFGNVVCIWWENVLKFMFLDCDSTVVFLMVIIAIPDKTNHIKNTSKYIFKNQKKNTYFKFALKFRRNVLELSKIKNTSEAFTNVRVDFINLKIFYREWFQNVTIMFQFWH